ncbi:hypothetical protein FRC03_000154 [Tulasnella sp. 419]|nr:hypothetical protein FRC02_000466 [Tulasnella sp. 418]KAG8965783.1 hypothetical protein FRC03_000154 [Tulasnella sp. 419]
MDLHPPSVPDGKLSLNLTGPKGQTAIPIESFIKLTHETPEDLAKDKKKKSTASSLPAGSTLLSVAIENSEVKKQRQMWGLTRTLIANAVKGLTEGWVVPLKLVGVGYRAAVENDPHSQDGKGLRLNMKLGYAHAVYVPVPEGITVETPQPTRIVLRGTDKNQLGMFAAQIRNWRKPEPYKGKGIFVGNETIKLKAVKKK